MADQAPPKDWEKEYSAAFTKKIPFPTMRYEVGRLNPVLDNILYTFATVNIHEGTKFELYVEQGTDEELAKIVADLRAEQKKQGPISLAPGQVKETEGLTGISDLDPMNNQDGATTAEVAAPTVVKETVDLTEKALIVLAERRANDRRSRVQDREDKTKVEEKKTEEKKFDEEEGEEDIEEEKKEDVAFDKENVDFIKVPLDPTYGENLKKCTKVLTMWEIKNTSYRKIKETYFFETMSTSIEFSKDGKTMMLSQSDNKTMIVYDAINLNRLSKFEISAKDTYGNDVYFYYGTLLSYDGSYVIAGDSYTKYIFDKDGKFLNTCSGRSMYTIFMYSKTEFVGTKYADDNYSKTNLVAVDFIKDTETVLYQFDSYVSNFYANQDFSQIAVDTYPKLNVINLKGDKEKKEVISSYYSLYRVVFKKNKMGVIYSTNYTSMFVALFEDGKQKWKHQIKKSYLDIHGLKFTNDDVDSLILLEMYSGCLQVYLFEENYTSDYCIKAIRNINFQYPVLAYVWGTRELWVQDMDNIVRIYYFDGSIAGMENDSNVKSDPNKPFTLGLVIDQYDYYQIGNFTYTNENNELEVYKRRIQKSELPNAKVKAFYKIRMQNHQRKMIEEAVLIHFKDSFVAISLESRDIKSEIQKAVSKANVIPLRDKSAIFFWEDKGDKIEMLKLPYDPTSAKALQKVYEADDELKFVKSTMIENEEYLSVVDEPKYVKILKIDDNRVTIHKDYFVDTYFATSTDNQYLKQYSFCNEMMYSSSGGYMLQEKGKEKEFKFATMYFSQYSLDYNTTKFPMCTQEFILFALNPEWNSSYTQQKQYLLLAPPINSYQIKQRAIEGYNSHEFFLHFDDKYIVYSKYDPNMDPRGITHGSLKLSLYQLNGEVLQTIKIPTHTKTYRPTYSQNGEYMVVPVKRLNTQIETKNLMSKMQNPQSMGNGVITSGFNVYKIKRSETYMRLNSGPQDVLDQNQNLAESKDIFEVEIVKQIDLPPEFNEEQGKRRGSPLDDLEDGDDEIIFLHVDNKGNVIFFLPEKKIFMINETSHWNSFNDYVLKRCKELTDIEIVKFGQGTMVVKILETILYMKYTEKKLLKGKEIKHKALDITGE